MLLLSSLKLPEIARKKSCYSMYLTRQETLYVARSLCIGGKEWAGALLMLQNSTCL